MKESPELTILKAFIHPHQLAWGGGFSSKEVFSMLDGTLTRMPHRGHRALRELYRQGLTEAKIIRTPIRSKPKTRTVCQLTLKDKTPLKEFSL